MQIKLHLVNGSERLLEIDDSDDADKTRLGVDDAADAIVQEWIERGNRRNAKAGSQFDRNKWLRPILYELILALEIRGLIKHLNRRMYKSNRFTESENLFHRSIFAVFVNVSSEEFTASDCRKMARQLWYAGRHYVPTIFLNGFLSQIEIFEYKEDLKTIEPGFYDWIVKESYLDHVNFKSRVIYP